MNMLGKRLGAIFCVMLMLCCLLPEAMADSNEVVKLRVWGFGYTSTSDDCKAVAEAMSQITREKIGVEIELIKNSDGEKLNLAMNSGEQLDLVIYHTYPGGLSALVTNDLALPIDDLVAQYGQGALSFLDERLLQTGKVNGNLYSLPSMKDFATGYGIAMRKDVLDELGIDPEGIKTWDDIHDTLVKVKEGRPDLYPIVPTWGGGGMQKAIPYDNLGTGFLDALGVLANVFDGSTTVVNLYETDAYRELCERMYAWNQEGLVMPDATTSNESNLCETVGFADFENYNTTKVAGLSQQWGHDAVFIRMVEPFISSNAGGSSYFIPAETRYPEKAMELWNLLYTDSDLSTIFLYGVEGVHFEYMDEAHTRVKTIDGSTYDVMDWTVPNAWIAPIGEKDEEGKWETLKQFCEEAYVSPALGFSFDSSRVMNEITACNNVIAKYEVGLRWGVLNPDEALPKFNEELYSAGLQTIMDEKQAQLDAFLGK